jgi:hypothetical protein
MAELKTKQTEASVDDFLVGIADPQQQEDSVILRKLMQDVTGQPAKMWGSSIVGFGQYRYKSKRSGQEGDWMAAGFSPRKGQLTVYVMDGFDAYQDLLAKIGKHKTSKGGCLYIKRLSDIDQGVLRKLVAKSVKHVTSGTFLA